MAQVPPLGGRSVANLSDLISPPTQTREVVKKIAYLITSTKKKKEKEGKAKINTQGEDEEEEKISLAMASFSDGNFILTWDYGRRWETQMRRGRVKK